MNTIEMLGELQRNPELVAIDITRKNGAYAGLKLVEGRPIIIGGYAADLNTSAFWKSTWKVIPDK
jgi:hypothetical protein